MYIVMEDLNLTHDDAMQQVTYCKTLEMAQGVAQDIINVTGRQALIFLARDNMCPRYEAQPVNLERQNGSRCGIDFPATL